jgi:hypothetical protein
MFANKNLSLAEDGNVKYFLSEYFQKVFYIFKRKLERAPGVIQLAVNACLAGCISMHLQGAQERLILHRKAELFEKEAFPTLP